MLLLVNLAAVFYLVWSKHLFGVRGGHAAFEAERHAASLLEVEKAAVDGVKRQDVANAAHGSRLTQKAAAKPTKSSKWSSAR